MTDQTKEKRAAAAPDLAQAASRHAESLKKYDAHIYCCGSTGCKSAGGYAVYEAFLHSVKTQELAGRVRVVKTGCMGLCGLGPLVRVEIKDKPPVLYKNVEALFARLIVAEHVLPAIRHPVEFSLSPFLKEHVLSMDIPFFTKQKKVVLEHLDHMDPESIEEYCLNGGYKALHKALTEMNPADVAEEIKKSGLRGRGGGGFSTGLKWSLAAKEKSDEKYIICNGDEGDPGAYMDSCTLEGDPHAVIEGMIIAAYAIGATNGWFYIRAEYPLAVERITGALKQAKKYGLLGKNIMGTGFDFDCELRLGAGAFVCGEETALMTSIEGRRGTPRPRPPYPTQKGLFGKPSCINNVETLANVPSIIRNGSAWFSSMGTATSKGTKVFALTGHVKNGGLVEVPMGTPMREIIEVIGDGTESGKVLKAVQTGGPSGGVIPAEKLDLPVCYEALKSIGSIMGSGGMITMDESDDMVGIAQFYLGFIVDESCGKCAPCRIGSYQMLHLLNKIKDGKGSLQDIDKIERLAYAMQKGSLCGLGQTAPNPVLSTLHFFRREYEAKLEKAKEQGREGRKNG